MGTLTNRRAKRDSQVEERAARDTDGEGYIKKSSEHFLQERWQIFQFIKDFYTVFPIEKMCKVLKVSRSAYYSWLNHKPSKREMENERITRMIRKIFFKSKKTYGSPRITMRLKKLGFRISKNRVAAIMRKEGLRSVVRKKFVVTTDSKHNYPVAGNLLNRNFMVSGPGQV